MKILILVLIVVAAVVGYPLLAEDTARPCDALVLRALNDSHELSNADAITTAVVRVLGGPIAERFARHRNPDFTPLMTCTALFWQITLDPSSTKQVLADLRSDSRRSVSTNATPR